jgi:membrane fusion protein, multidrug efflux system
MRTPSAVGLLTLAITIASLQAGCQRAGREDATASAPAGSAPSGAASGPGGRGATAVSVFSVQKRDVPVIVEAAGTVVALDAVEVRPQLSGTIAEVLVKDGDFVRRGQPLFRLDVRAQQANVDRARAQLLRDQAALADLERQWKRAQELRAENFIAQSAADTVRANLEAQRAAVAASQASVRAAQVDVSFGTIAAPLSGRIGAVAVHRGSLVQPGGAALVGINQIDPIGVAFSVPESQLAALLRAPGGSAQEAGTEVIVSAPGAMPERGRPATAPAAAVGPAGGMPGTAGTAGAAGVMGATGPTGTSGTSGTSGPPGATGAAGPSGATNATNATNATGANAGAVPSGAPGTGALRGKVVFVDNAVDTPTGTIKVKAELANKTQALWPGQYVSVRMTTRTLSGALVIPQAALVIRGNDRSVYVVRPDSTVESRPVQTRLPTGEFVVVEGLQEGDRVVVDGKQNVRPGASVRPTPWQAAGADRRSAGAGGGPRGAAGGARAASSAASAPSAGTGAAPLPGNGMPSS